MNFVDLGSRTCWTIICTGIFYASFFLKNSYNQERMFFFYIFHTYE